MKINTVNEVEQYKDLINNCTMIEAKAKSILCKNPSTWGRIVTNAFSVTVKGNSITTNMFATDIVNCSFVKFLEILENSEITLTVESGLLVFLGTGDIEEILLDALYSL